MTHDQEDEMASNRHPATTQLRRWFEYDHLPAGIPRTTSQRVAHLVEDLLDEIELPDGPELSAGLRKLLEAKDCFVRAAIDKTS